MSNFSKKTATGFWIPIRSFLILLGMALAVFVLTGSYLMSTLFPPNIIEKAGADKNQKILLQDVVVSDAEKKMIDAWLSRERLNQYGDPQGTLYQTDPLLDPNTQDQWDRYQYLKNKFPQRPWQ